LRIILKVAAAVLVGFLLLAVVVWARFLRIPTIPVPALSGTVHHAAIEVQGRSRSFTYYLPRTLAPNAALILVLHGSGMDGAVTRPMTAYAFDELADREGVVVAYPDGYGGYWNECRVVGDYEAKRQRIDDVTFLRALIDWFARRHKVARDRVFATGVSAGGQMVYRVALEAPELVRAIAAVSASLPTRENQICTPSGRPIAVMIINGTEDPINPYNGGDVALFRIFLRRGPGQSSMDTARYWAELAGHRNPPQRQPLPDVDPSDHTVATRLLWSGENRPDVALVTIEGGGHTFPHPHGAVPRLLGRTSHDFDAAEEMWSFFNRQH
jgi:polyhydroxybutyrate depolymerase